MRLERLHLEKADPLLQDVLRRADGHEILHVIMVLASQVENGEIYADQELDPSHFASRKDYRQYLITKRQDQLRKELGETFQALRNLSLNFRGETISRAVVVEGAAHNILKALELPGIYRASLDTPVIEKLSNSE